MYDDAQQVVYALLYQFNDKIAATITGKIQGSDDALDDVSNVARNEKRNAKIKLPVASLSYVVFMFIYKFL